MIKNQPHRVSAKVRFEERPFSQQKDWPEIPEQADTMKAPQCGAFIVEEEEEGFRY